MKIGRPRKEPLRKLHSLNAPLLRIIKHGDPRQHLEANALTL
jgi:hypothetical protein